MSGPREPLGADELEAALVALPSWRLEGGALVRVVPLRTYAEGPPMVAQVAALAEELDHHPVVSLSYGALAITTSTHQPPGISKLDLELAARLDELLA